MTTTPHTATSVRERATPTMRLMSASLLAAPLTYLAADALYAARGWDDASAGAVHVLGAILYGVLVLAIASRLPRESRLTAALAIIGLLGIAGNVAYGFDAIHASFGDVRLVDRSGAATIIKPLGLCFPLSLLLIAAALRRVGHDAPAVTVAVAGLLWPVAHIANVAELAVMLNVALVLAFGGLAVGSARASVQS